MRDELVIVLFSAIAAACACGPASGADSAAAGPGGAGGAGGGASASGSGGGGALSVCPKQHDETTPDGRQVVVCEEGYSEAPYVRPPEDSAEGALRTVFAGLTLGQTPQLHMRSGAIPLHPDDAALFGGEHVGGSQPASDRYAYALYEVTLDDADRVKGFAPRILIQDQVFLDTYLAGRAFEGMISRSLGPDECSIMGASPCYELSPSAPIRVTFGDAAKPGQEPDLHGFPVATIEAVVENTDAPVKGSSGGCMPALSSLGASDPFATQGKPVTLVFSRIPNMHGGFDDVLVVEWPMGGSNMGGGQYAAPWRLMTGQAPPDAYNSAPHGTPWSAPQLQISPVEGGGGPCP